MFKIIIVQEPINYRILYGKEQAGVLHEIFNSGPASYNEVH